MIILAPVLFLSAAVSCVADEPSKTAPADAKQIQKLIRDLGADEFSVREKATKELSSIGRSALPALREALQSADLEVRQRARHAMDAIQTSTQYLTGSLKDPDPALRKEAAEILERLGP